MDGSQSALPGSDAQPNAASMADPRLQPTPDFGTLGPGSDFVASSATAASTPSGRMVNSKRFGPVVAVAIGVLFAVFVGSIGSAHAAWGRFANLFALRADELAPPSAPTDPRQLDHLKPQVQAETLLEQAVGHSDVAVDQISSRVDHWQGKLKWNSQIAKLTTAALNSSDMRVRESGIEIELAAYGLGKNSASLDYLLQTAESPDHSRKIWALWALGLMGNRGMDADHVVKVLTGHLQDSDNESRYWAVQGLSLVGGDQAIAPLLASMHDDPSPKVRESAACGLAESGMFTQEQRLSAVPHLVSYTNDPALDAQTHAWAFQALTEITHQHLPNDASAWHSWYESNRTQ